LEVSISAIIYDRSLNKQKNLVFGVSESTKIKKKIIFKGYKEGGYLYRNPDYLSNLINDCSRKVAGKSASFIKKQRRRSAKGKKKKGNKITANSSSVLANNSTSSQKIQAPDSVSSMEESVMSAAALFTTDFFVDERNNQQFSTINYSNNQSWMGENLKTSQFQNGDTIVQSKSYKEWKHYTNAGIPTWAAYNFSGDGNSECGKLYNWFAVIDDRNLAPRGWHIATESEWIELSATLGDNKKEVGNKLKSTSGWILAGHEGTVHYGNGNNESGLNCAPCGCIANGDFITYGDPIKVRGRFGYGSNGFWWFPMDGKSKPSIIRMKWSGKLTYIKAQQNAGYSVRCVKDY
jgi:uncharacterized protein (TIGR02145 family)